MSEIDILRGTRQSILGAQLEQLKNHNHDSAYLGKTEKAADSDKLDGYHATDIALLSYPVGAIYMSYNSTSPATLFGGTWSALGGRFLIGVDGTYTAGSTGGAATHQLTAAEMPTHAHEMQFSHTQTPNNQSVYASGDSAQVWHGNMGFTTSTGGNNAHNNMPPFLAVYMWRRTA